MQPAPLAAEIQARLSQGWQLQWQRPDAAVMTRPAAGSPNAIATVALVLAPCTLGLSLVVWGIVAYANRPRSVMLRVDQHGRVVAGKPGRV